jgi:hypothetical protein
MSRTVRTAAIALVILSAMYVLFTVVFPWVDREFFANPVLG